MGEIFGALRGAAQAVGKAARGAARVVGSLFRHPTETRATETRATETRATETRATETRATESASTGVPAPGMGAEGRQGGAGRMHPQMEPLGGKPVEWKDDPGVKAGLQELYADTVDVWKGLPYDRREDIVIAHFDTDTLENAARIWGEITGKKIEEYSRPEEPGEVKYSTARTLSNRAKIRRWKAEQ